MKSQTLADSLHIPVSEKLSAAVRKRIDEKGFSSKSEYIRALIRADVEPSKE